jgi:hypothetical protein
MPASKALETSLVCTYLARSVLFGGINDDFICYKIEKKSLVAAPKISKDDKRDLAIWPKISIYLSNRRWASLTYHLYIFA